MKVYLLPGLGFDQRMFEPLGLDAFDITYINWIDPLPKETIRAYAQRLLQDINDEEENVLIGHSFGGLIAQEIAQVKKIKKIILISSVQSRDELPLHFKIIKPLGVYRGFLKSWILKTVKFWGGYHDFRSQEELDLFKNMVRTNSNLYLQWALRELSQWQAPLLPAHTEIIQIHGTKDKTFPLRLIKNPDHIITGGGHFMVFRERVRLREILEKKLRC